MRSLKKSGFIAALVAVAAIFLVYVPSQAAYPPQGDDLGVSTLGQYRIWVHPKFQGMVNGCPGYDPATGKWDGPLMRDLNTIIGRSGPHADAAAPDNPPGTPVGTVGTMISDADFTIRALQCGGDGPPGQQEIHTEIVSMNMVGGGATVRAGQFLPDYPAPKGDGTPTVSPGEVEDQPGGGTDFPAESFFDIYVEVDLPGCGGIPDNPILYNRIPMVVFNCALNSLPPTVVYQHGNTTLPPFRFTS